MTAAKSDPVAALRRFNRFYTRELGFLNEGLLDSSFSLTEARVLYELAHADTLSASDLCRDIALDAGYASRILKSFERQGLIVRTPSPRDGRQSLVSMTPAGREAFAALDKASREQVGTMLDGLPPDAPERLIAAMAEVERILTGHTEPYSLRPPRVGDIGWVIHRQAVLYNQEYGWNGDFEILLADILAAMMKDFDPAKERGWIAERGNKTVGSVWVVRKSATVAKLRLLYVEPSARGLGIGRRLVDECIRFARDKGYATLTLWTNDPLVAARRIYVAAGFTLAGAEPVHAFGQDMVSETWELSL